MRYRGRIRRKKIKGEKLHIIQRKNTEKTQRQKKEFQKMHMIQSQKIQ